MQKSLIVIMGPSGCGKSSVAGALAPLIPAASMIEADDHHSPAARARMASGQALSDTDREPWVARLCEACTKHPSPIVILACSALTPIVQEALRSVRGRHVQFVMLDATHQTLARRMEERSDHFMPPSLLRSQLNTLKPPADAIHVDADRPIAAICRDIAARLEDEAEG